MGLSERAQVGDNMEAWLAELEMVIGPDFIKMDHNPQTTENHHHHQCGETMEKTSFDEVQLAATLGLSFPPCPLSSESNTSSPQLDFDYTSLMEPFPYNNNNINNDVAALVSSNPLQPGAPTMPQDHDQKDKEEADHDDGKKQQQVAGNGKRRKREPSQVLDHIMAERKRRELLSRLFIALSAIVPGLKKTDKTSVLGEAIKYLKQLQDKVKVLEEVAAKRTVESVVVVKKSQLVVDGEGVDDNGSSCTFHLARGGGGGSGTSGGDGGSGGSDHLSNESLPEIEVRVSDKTILFKIYCEKQKGTLPNLFSKIEKFDHLSVVSCGVIPFGSLALDITLTVQKEEGFDKNVTGIVRTLQAALLFA